MINSITHLPDQSKEELAYEKLIEIFNAEAKKQGSKFRIETQYSYPHLVKHFFWNFGNSLGTHQMIWFEPEDLYAFIGGINEETFNEVKPILESIELKFKIELV